MCFNLADGPSCRICADERRDPELICVVEEPSDVISIERTHEFRGRYHVLGGALSPIDGIDPEDLKIAELYAPGRAERDPRGRDRDEPDDDRRGDRAAHRRRAARARARGRGHAAGERAAGRRRPRVRRRADARPGVRGSPGGLGAAAPAGFASLQREQRPSASTCASVSSDVRRSAAECAAAATVRDAAAARSRPRPRLAGGRQGDRGAGDRTRVAVGSRPAARRARRLRERSHGQSARSITGRYRRSTRS